MPTVGPDYIRHYGAAHPGRDALLTPNAPILSPVRHGCGLSFDRTLSNNVFDYLHAPCPFLLGATEAHREFLRGDTEGVIRERWHWEAYTAFPGKIPGSVALPSSGFE